MMEQKDINEYLYGLYGDVYSGSVSIQCRKQHHIYDQSSFVYGDSHLPSLADILSLVKPKKGEVFYDLGSGTGRVVVFAAMSFPFKKCIGVELLAGLHSMAKRKQQELKSDIRLFQELRKHRISKIEFKEDDIVTTKLRNADVIYMASTCFDDALMLALANNLERQVSEGTRVITCTKCLPSSQFQVFEKKVFKMEWGQVTVFFQEKTES